MGVPSATLSIPGLLSFTTCANCDGELGCTIIGGGTSFLLHPLRAMKEPSPLRLRGDSGERFCCSVVGLEVGAERLYSWGVMFSVGE